MEAVAIQLGFILVFLVIMLVIVMMRNSHHNSNNNNNNDYIVVKPPIPNKFLKVNLPREFNEYKIKKIEAIYEKNGIITKIEIPIKE